MVMTGSKRFDRLAQEWDLKPQRVASAKNLSEKLAKYFDLEGMKIVDYGAGTGLVSFNLCEKAHQVIAMDNAQKMLDEIEKKAQNAGIENVHTRYHDITKEELPKEMFDLFISSMTMHHIPDTKSFLQKAKESVIKGGYVAINDLEKEDGSFHSMGNDDVAHFGFEREKLENLFEDVGLEVVSYEVIEVIEKAKKYPIFLIIGKHV